jgi:uncharacterized iron-regulated membrane protein
MRKLLFWTHLIAGVGAAVVVFIMAVTGTLLMYERQIIEWADRDVRFTTSRGAPLEAEALLRVVAAKSGAKPEALTLRASTDAAAEVTAGTRTIFVDPYSGSQLGEGSIAVRRVFRMITDWHRWLAMTGSWRPVGRAITGAANLAFLGLAITGIFLWLPRKWTWNSVRAVLWFKPGLSGKARDFNWHNAIGIWCAVPLIAVILGALVISYPWATNLVYRIAGSGAPPAPAPQNPQGGPRQPAAAGPNVDGLNAAVAQARKQVPGWQSIAWRASSGETIVLTVAESHRGRVDLRSTITVDRSTGKVVRTEAYSDQSRGRQWRLWLRFVHTGEALGIVGQSVAGVASAGAAVLAWTGLALAWRRLRAWFGRRRRKGQQVESDSLQSV